ncbi:hypothetical protein AX17_005317 [Amanita inopinata Kibby_2008]|nr:hypothetical protein AX17_005317 [Amanita inopinata Kibby_2008]
MHHRNPYRQPLDFVALAEAYEPLKAHLRAANSCHGEFTIDFKNADSQRRLTEALLYRDFDIKVILPDERLCPPVPNRLNYILWLQDIIRAHKNYIDSPDSDINGIDIGTGASAIYPLLGCRLEGKWRFTATDRIHLIKTDRQKPILWPLELEPTRSFDFTMCNPPFYESTDEMLRSAEAKGLPPNAVCTGADIEMITPGGELAFVGRMVKESEKYRTRCRWYTSMLGKLSSVTQLVKSLKTSSISNYAITEFIQGQTRRWAIAWSFTDMHLPDSIARIPNPVLQPHMPQRNTLDQLITIPVSSYAARTNEIVPEKLKAALLQALSQIEDVTVQERAGALSPSSPSSTLGESEGEQELGIHVLYFTVEARRNTWSRSARRRALHRERDVNDKSQTHVPTSIPNSMMCGIELKTCPTGSQNENRAGKVTFEWLYGRERILFESFVRHVTRKMQSNIVE